MKTQLSLSIFQRALLMALCSVVILLGAMLIQLNGVQHMLTLLESQIEQGSAQNTSIQAQTGHIDHQRKRISLQRTVQQAFDLYSEYMFWRYNSVLTQDSLAVANADAAEQQLRQQLEKIYEQDEELGEAADAVAIYLDDFNTRIAEAINLAYQEAPLKSIASALGRAQSDAMAMNEMFELILDESSESVAGATDQLAAEANTLLLSSEAMQQAAKAARADGIGIKESAVLILLVAVIISLVVGVLFSRSITQPIQRLHATIRSIEQNSDLTRRVNYHKRNEIGAIASAVNAMQEKFQAIVTQLATTTSELDQSAQRSAHIADQTSANADRLHQETDMVATASNEMAVTVKGINETTMDAVERAAEAQEQCETGKQAVAETKAVIVDLHQQIESSAKDIDSLAHQAEAIGGVLDVIRGIAEQTNLLALNAAIEAARAGEQGRGFAVVADEVRGLAQKTGNSTNEIQTMIEALQAESQQAVSQMTRSQEQTASAQTVAMRASEAIDAVLQSVVIMNNSNQQISHATQEQSIAAESIDQSIVSISELTNSVNAAATETREASQGLNSMVGHLRQLIGQFTY